MARLWVLSPLVMALVEVGMSQAAAGGAVFPVRMLYAPGHFGNSYEVAGDNEMREWLSEAKRWGFTHYADWFDTIEPHMIRWGPKQIHWPVIKEPYPEETGPPPAPADVLNPEMWEWRKKMIRYSLKLGSRYPSFIGLQFDEVLPDDYCVGIRRELQPHHLNAGTRTRIAPFFHEYLTGKYENAELKEIGLYLAASVKLPVSTSWCASRSIVRGRSVVRYANSAALASASLVASTRSLDRIGSRSKNR